MYRLSVIGLCAHSAFNPVAADECPGEPDLSAPAGTKFFGAGNGWCSSDLDKKVGPACTPAECWDLCVEAYGADSIFAVELNGVGGSCYCQSACDCMESGGSDQYVIARDTLEELPDTCDDDWSNDDWSNNDDIECAGETNFTAPANTTFFGDSVGWCSSDLNGNVGRACTPAECWDLCVDAYGADAIFAADLSTSGSCYCQNSCDCMDGSGSYQVIARDTLEELPDACDDDWAPECPGEANFTAPAGTTFFEATGWCDSSLNAYVGQACTPAECWDLCVDAYGADAIFAADLEYAGGSCYCQNSCDCMDGSGPNQVIARDTLEELPDACVTECSCPYQYDGECDVDLGYCSCDPHDCSSLGSIFVCEACVDAGGVFCAKDALCAAPGEAPSLETLQTFVKTATCDAADYSTDCPAHPLPDPAYDAVAWYLGAINVEEVWAAGITGAGVTVLINDEGVDASHPDLKKLSVEDSCDNYLNGAATDTHGTVCAALAVGSSNKHCGVGVAHGASLASCKTMGEGDTDEDVAAFAKGDVNSNSWGIDSCFVPTSYSFDYDRRLDDACPFSSDVYDTPCSYYACYDADFSRGGGR
ncbi:serine-type endopeptidase [Aureococcus anophagefferens]|nr:serine-type endopeptidase [Aureococcus anophagefferens]